MKNRFKSAFQNEIFYCAEYNATFKLFLLPCNENFFVFIYIIVFFCIFFNAIAILKLLEHLIAKRYSPYNQKCID